ncbi:MAG: GTPase Era [Acidimicrobiaceae bacterium]|nr:GTPase Era [Acidimicrobiaceae bacterium]MCY4176557.1 GTPase Era [Acidimicrobiaceae bacterium]MCY4280599.1 GTPase Era [Acidimicrobiaceae bacterium]MCY4294705.1 GTPase Era [Acidimicrobiaceae bacterium]
MSMTRAQAHRSGMVGLAGRPNAGKSTLINRIIGQKVSIVSDKPQTTRAEARAVLTRPDAQLVLVDTPGIHKPRNAFGQRLNAAASQALDGLDVACLVIDAAAPYGRGDAFVAASLPSDSVVVVTKSDLVGPNTMLQQLAALGELDFEAYFPVSGLTGEGVEALLEHLVQRLPESPPLYPPETVSDSSPAFWVAELVRERLLAVARDELPHAITTRVTEWDWPLVRCEITVERPSQKAIVIGRGGARLKEVGTAVRAELPDGAYLQLAVKVDKNWHNRDPRQAAR